VVDRILRGPCVRVDELIGSAAIQPHPARSAHWYLKALRAPSGSS
jgi:hypothetical protein